MSDQVKENVFCEMRHHKRLLTDVLFIYFDQLNRFMQNEALVYICTTKD